MSSRRLSWEKLTTRLWTILMVSAAERPASPAGPPRGLGGPHWRLVVRTDDELALQPVRLLDVDDHPARDVARQ